MQFFMKDRRATTNPMLLTGKSTTDKGTNALEISLSHYNKRLSIHVSPVEYDGTFTTRCLFLGGSDDIAKAGFKVSVDMPRYNAKRVNIILDGLARLSETAVMADWEAGNYQGLSAVFRDSLEGA